MLTGGNGADTFSYSYTMTTSTGVGPQSYADYLGSLELKSDELTQSQLSTTYSTWLNYLVFGGEDGWQGLVDKFGWEGEVTIGLNQNGAGDNYPHISVDGETPTELDDIFGDADSVTWTKGKATQTRSFWDLDEDYDWGGGTTVSSDDGKDTITDFNADDDTLFFTIDAEVLPTTDAEQLALITEFKSKFTITQDDFDGDSNTDTKLVLDDGMSITLLGYDGGDNIWGHVEFDFV